MHCCIRSIGIIEPVLLGILERSGIYENLEVTVCDHLILKFQFGTSSYSLSKILFAVKLKLRASLVQPKGPLILNKINKAPYFFGAKSWNSQMVGPSVAFRMFSRT